MKEHKLFVGNLDARVREFDVLRLCEPFGKIVREQFLWHESGPRKGQPRGFCFVEFSTRKEAEDARRELDGRSLLGRPLTVRFVTDRLFFKHGEGVSLDASPAELDSLLGLSHADGSGFGASSAAALAESREYRTPEERVREAALAKERERVREHERRKTMARRVRTTIQRLRSKISELVRVGVWGTKESEGQPRRHRALRSPHPPRSLSFSVDAPQDEIISGSSSSSSTSSSSSSLSSSSSSATDPATRKREREEEAVSPAP